MDITGMTTSNEATSLAERPSMLARSIILMKPVTWFPPTWAFLCGAVASGVVFWSVPNLLNMFLGMVMAGPILCGMSQVINDWYDRDVDALNEPDRLIPSGQVTQQQVWITTAVLVVIGLAIGLYLGRWVSVLVVMGLLLAVAYSAPPIRAKQNGWFGNLIAAISYEGLAWVAGHLAFAAISPQSLLIAALYSLGTHGIMSINDYKSIEGDTQAGVRTIPVQHGPKGAAWLIVWTMVISQILVITAFAVWGNMLFASILLGVLIAQIPLQYRFVKDPMGFYLMFSAFGVLIFVIGMLIAAIGLRGL